LRSVFSKTFFGVIFLSLCLFTTGAGQTLAGESAARLLLDRFGNFRAAGAAVTAKPEFMTSFGNDNEANLAASRPYISNDGQRIWLTIIRTGSDSVAYALLTEAKHTLESSQGRSGANAGVGADSFVFPDRLLFVKGSALIAVNLDSARAGESQALVDIARAVADTLDKGQGDIPVLVKHLPDWQNAQRRILYAVNANTLKKAISNQPILDAVSFEGGAEAVIADYETERLVVVEFNTPQLATENDSRITGRVRELRNQGQPVPTAYRRVGNYSVFVFDAPSEQAANQLIDQVQYQQVVQWLGKNPYAYGDAVREFTQTTLGVLVSVVKASGLALLSSLAIGGFLGALLFTRRRRAQQQLGEAYSDAGGMLRLNLDEVNSKTDPARLLGPGN
jgi:hypothetical protein